MDYDRISGMRSIQCKDLVSNVTEFSLGRDLAETQKVIADKHTHLRKALAKKERATTSEPGPSNSEIEKRFG